MGLPDQHPDKGHAVGAAFVYQEMIYPFLVGSDIGCGVGLWTMGVKVSKVKWDVWGRRLVAMEEPWDGDTSSWLADHGISPPLAETSLGTIGLGNHFAELQAIDGVEDPAILESLCLSKDRLSRTRGANSPRSYLSPRSQRAKCYN